MEGTLQGGKVEDHRMMCTKHLHLPQLYIQAILYINKTDCMMFFSAFKLGEIKLGNLVLTTEL